MKKKTAAKTRKAKPFRLELGWSGMFGLVVVCFCLFLWMFLLGMWAGQVIFPPTGEADGTGKSANSVAMGFGGHGNFALVTLAKSGRVINHRGCTRVVDHVAVL